MIALNWERRTASKQTKPVHWISYMVLLIPEEVAHRDALPNRQPTGGER